MSDDGSMNRRELIEAAGLASVAGLTGLAGCSGDGGDSGDTDTPTDGGGGDTTTTGGGNGGSEYPELGNFPVEGDTVTLGFNVPQSGAYASEGNDELKAYRLAKMHLNNGGGWVDMWDDLSSGGILGKTVEETTGDTATDAKQASEHAKRMINRDDAIMISGGVSSAVAIAQSKVCQQEKVNFMACLTHSNATQGADCQRYSFREMHNAYMTGKALAPVLADEFGSDVSYYQMYADYTWGQSVRNSMDQFLKEQGWSNIKNVPTKLGASDFSTYMQDVPRDEADVLILTHFGGDAANSMPAAFSAGLDEDMEIVLPLYDKIAATAAKDNIGGVYGTVDWNWQRDEEYSNAFTDAFMNEYDSAPSYAARLAYTATMQYAAAVERADTFYPPEVIKELEGHSFSNTGIGEGRFEACDHQARRDVFVVQGRTPDEQTEDKLLKVVGRTDADTAGYGCDEGPAAKCELGPYE